MGQVNSGGSISLMIKHIRQDEEKSLKVLKWKLTANNFYSLYLMQ